MCGGREGGVDLVCIFMMLVLAGDFVHVCPSLQTPPPPSIKRRRVSGNAPSAAGGSGGVAAPGAETRKRRWGSGRQRSNSGSTSISTDVLKVLLVV